MKQKILQILLFILVVWIFLYSNNHWLQTTNSIIESERVPEPFDGLKIVQLSDLHDAVFGENQSLLAEKVRKLHPDLIFITGDVIDSNRYDLHNSLDLVRQLIHFAPVYYVTGNHEVAVNKVEEITEALRSLGVHVLMNEAVTLERHGEKLAIAGIEDPLMHGLNNVDETVRKSMDDVLARISVDTYKILLSHRPEVFDVYVEKELDLIFTGHAHGGQFRIPGLGGLVAPGQGWLPAYTAGNYERGITTMIVSRGLGNSIIPFRIFNRPEIVVVTLKRFKSA